MGVSTANDFVYDTHFCERVTQTSEKEHRFGMVMSVKITRPVRLKIRCVMETFYGVEITYDEAKIARDKRVIGLETLGVGKNIVDNAIPIIALPNARQIEGRFLTLAAHRDILVEQKHPTRTIPLTRLYSLKVAREFGR